MSFKLMVHAWDAEVPTQSHRLVLMKLVDCCDDDGRNIFPKIQTVARAAKCSDRHVQRVLGEFCRIGLLRRVKAGGQGRASAAHYEMDLDLLGQLRRPEIYPAMVAAAQFEPLGDENESEPHAPDAHQAGDVGAASAFAKGDRESPLRSDRVTPETAKGDKLSHPHITPQEPLIDREKRERAGEHALPADGDAVAAAVPSFEQFLEAYPHARGDNRVRQRSAWEALAFDQRQPAIDGISAFLAERREGGLKGRLSSEMYLQGRCWIGLEAKASERKAKVAAGAPVAVSAWSRDWWLILIDRCQRGEKVGFHVQRAEAGQPVSATEADLAAMRARVGELSAWRCDGFELEAWRPWLAQRGARIGVLRGDFRVFLPGPMPPGGKREEGDEDVQF